MSEDEELSDDELNALISDLESRSEGGSSGGGASGGGDLPEGDDLDEFLQEVEEDVGGSADEAPEAGEATVTYEESGEEGPSLPELEELEKQQDQPPAKAEETSPSQAEPSSEEEASASEAAEPADGEQAAAEGTASEQRESSAGTPYLRYTWVGAKWIGYTLPVLAFWWLLGAYLGQWVSAGWLILAITTVVVFGIPKLAYDFSKKRGRYRWWLAGLSLVFSIGLVAPLTGPAGRALAGYGHWPGEVVSEVAGSGAGIGAATGGLGAFVGSQLNPDIPEEAVRIDLGSSPTPKK